MRTAARVAGLLLLAVTVAAGPVYPAHVTLTPVSASEFLVRVPVKNGISAQVVAEYRFSRHATTHVWWISNCTVKDLRGGVSDIVLTEPDSVWGYAMQIGAQSDGGFPTGYGFYGEGHGNETRLTLSIKIDDVEIGPVSGGGARIVIDQTMSILKPAGTGAGGVIGNGTLKHTIESSGVRIDHTHTITAAGLSYRTAYGAMMPVSNTRFDRSQAGSDAAKAITGSNTVTDTGRTHAYYQAYHSDRSVNPYRLKVTLPSGRPELDTPFSDVTAPKAWFFDGTAYGKWYLNWIGDTVTAITQGSTSTHQQFYEVIDAR